jgi:hypothetical protein
MLGKSLLVILVFGVGALLIGEREVIAILAKSYLR